MSRIERARLVVGVVGSMLAAGTLWGCQQQKVEEDTTATAQVSAERMGEIRQRYSAVEGYLVGEVEGVDAENHRAAVGGIDAKLVNNQSLFIFVDGGDGNTINSGTMHSHSAVSGRIFVNYFQDATAPKVGDLAVVKAAGK
jgi:hypothetical protein